MDAVTQAASGTAPASTKSLWIGRIISALIVLFMLFDGITKVIKLAPVMEASGRLGFPASVIQAIGAVLVVCTVAYLIPRTSVLGAVLLTGYLGGAVATQVRAGQPFVFPVVFGVLVWAGLFLRDERLRALVPLRRG